MNKSIELLRNVLMKVPPHGIDRLVVFFLTWPDENLLWRINER